MYIVVNQYYFPIAPIVIDKLLSYTFTLCNKSFKLNCNKYVLRPTVNKLSLKILLDYTYSEHSLNYGRINYY